MGHARSLMVLAFAVLARPAAAQQSGGFVTRLGTDTLAMERFTRTASRLEGEVVGRFPQVMVRTYAIDFGPDGRATRAEVTLRPPGEANPVQRAVATFTRDSMITETRRDTTVQTRRVALDGPAVAAPAGPNLSWAIADVLVEQLRGMRADSIQVAAMLVGATGGFTYRLVREGRDTLRITAVNIGAVWRGLLGPNGRLEAVVPVSGTAQFAASRIAPPDLSVVAAAWRAREQQAGQMGLLSPRDTVRATIAGASLWVDYGRPAKRGRVIFGGTVVPWGQVWRTGANAATQLRTDRALQIGGAELPAGLYTLWTIPSPGGWKLLINSQTGQWGTEHDPARDLFQLDLTMRTLPQVVERFTISLVPEGQGGVLRLQWDSTEASIPFTVR